MKKEIFIIFLFLFHTIFYTSCVKKETPSLPEDFTIPIFCYHHVHPYMKNNINTKPWMFERHLKFFKNQGYETILSKDIEKFKYNWRKNILGKNKRPIIITFDDGNRSVYKYAFPIMKKYNFKGIIFLISNMVRSGQTRNYLCKKEIKELIKNGWEIASHSCSHLFMHKCSINKLIEEISQSRLKLEQMFDVNVLSFAYPYGIFNEHILGTARVYYKYGFTIHEGNNHSLADFYKLQRHLVLRSTMVGDLKKMITAKRINAKVKTKVTIRRLCVIVEIPDDLKVYNLKIYFNYKRNQNYIIKGNKIIFKTWNFSDFNYFILYFQDIKKNNYCLMKLIYIDYKTDVY